ncbi:NUDIX domain-containing protein [Patescibacteria group bacterium]|nr:NUDIX domain-containing protein [Patescibacteria group bacterium]MBU4453126.1 NUDIX domain-containing protein [Patescibacteria group bacterium]MCG2687886.1 NUDIX domain-containing protein [Candidatus Parcubacteria bacterium]
MNQERHHSSTRQSVSSRQTGSQKKHRVEVSSGGLIFKRTPDGVFFAMQKDSYGHWTFPKGHVRRGESYRQTAVREIQEELGLGGLRYIKPLGTIDIWFRDRFVFKGKLVRKFIHYFLFEAKQDAQLVPLITKDKGERIEEAKWINIKEIWEFSGYDDMKPIVSKALAYFQKPKMSGAMRFFRKM